MPSSGMLRCVAVVITDVSEKLNASIIRVTRIGALRNLELASNRSSLSIYLSIHLSIYLYIQIPSLLNEKRIQTPWPLVNKRNIVNDSSHEMVI
jgi:hypothetical protein